MTAAASPSRRSLALDVLLSAAPEWALVLSLIFGGCCANAWSLEALTRASNSSGILLTLSQFAAISLWHLPSFLTFQRHDGGKATPTLLPRLKRRQVPLRKWMIQVVLFVAVNLLNNIAFKYHIPVPVHIVFRSGGLCVSLLLGYFVSRKRYTPLQILSVLSITIGITLATLCAPRPGGARSSSSADGSAGGSALEYAFGIGLLALALLLSGLMGLHQERTYRDYGSGTWREGLFYSHFLSLPLFPLLLPYLLPQLRTFNASPPLLLHLGTKPIHTPIPSFYAPLALNVLTQFVCITGVNRLTAKVSSLSVNLVLTLRKAASLVFSVWWYQSGWNREMVIGAAAVLLGSIGFSLASAGKANPPPAKATRADTVVEGKADSATGAVGMDGAAGKGSERPVGRTREKEENKKDR